MRRRIAFWGVVSALLFIAVTSHGDVANAPTAGGPTDEPITGTPLTTTPPPNTPAPRDPFTPYDVGVAHDPSNPNDHRTGTWNYADLDAANRAVVDRGRDVAGWAMTLDAFSTGSRELAARAASEAAARQLGTGDLATTGLVP